MVENFRYHPAINPDWRAGLAEDFKTAWRARIIAHKRSSGAPRKKQRTGARSEKTIKAARSKDALKELFAQWEDVAHLYDGYYAAFAVALSAS